MMKKFVVFLILAMLLTGCTAAETFETLGNVYPDTAMPVQRQVSLTVPEDASAQVIQSENGRLYLCDGYEITLQTLSGGDLNKTLRTLTGFGTDSLTVMETGLTENARYEFVWTAAGEGGDTVGRAVILDDGNYHYCVTVMGPADNASQLQDTWQSLLASFTLI